VDFAGWQMPLSYASQLQEHEAVRRAAGMFDVSHMGIIELQGKSASAYLRQLLANDIKKLTQPVQALYSVMLNEQAGIVDDLIVYRLAEDHYRLIVNAACVQKDFHWMSRQQPSSGTDLRLNDQFAIIAVQGPKAMEAVNQVWIKHYQYSIPALKTFHGSVFPEGMLARTGYTGEDGYEILIKKAAASQLWAALLEEGVRPCGLAARDSLRVEAGLNLYGQDMDESVSPLECNLAWTVDWQDPTREFIGRTALTQLNSKAQTLKRLVGLVLNERGMLRHGQKVWQQNRVIGELTSASFSPLLQRAIAFARVAAVADCNCAVAVRDKLLAATLVPLPFVRRSKIINANF
jgi:aminomethyltransferase